MPAVQTNHRISRADLESAIGRMIGDGEESVREAAPQVLVVVGAAVFCILTVTYLVGRRKGRRRSAVLEIRRV